MSSICALADFYSHSLNFALLRRMGSAMILRSKSRSGAYINGGIGLMQGGGSDELPYTLNLEGRRYTVIIDGEPILSEYDDTSSIAEQILRRYSRIGTELINELRGCFALVILDEYERKIILARDCLGAKPLYYCRFGNGIAAASEIKGLLPLFPDGARISLEAYRSLLIAPDGMIGGADIYRDILELEAGHILIFDGKELNTSRYTCMYSLGEDIGTTHVKHPSRQTLDSNIELLLCEALVAFDYPQFDLFMPPLMTLLKENRGERRISYEEPFLELDERYAFERADRLGTLFGTEAIPAASRSLSPISSKIARLTEKKLSELIEELECSDCGKSIFGLAGDTAIEIIRKERNCMRRARIFALLLQTRFWTENYRLVFD